MTGIAPMRALLQERKRVRDTTEVPSGRNILYFGCRNRNLDFIYKDELELYQKEHILSNLYLAFSRETPAKVYVQHLMLSSANEAELISELFEGSAYLYVCG
jgi:NADPH-ferrihemoprotein reductase